MAFDRLSDGVSATVPDWSRERCRRFWDPSRRLIRSIRQYQKWRARPMPLRLFSKYWTLQHTFWSVITGAEIPLTAQIGGGLLIPHPNGIVIHPDARIGCNCLIMQGATIGVLGHKSSWPTVGGHVDIGAGARILGTLTVGDHARIGANAVVLRDVPPIAVAVGVPARIIPADRPDPDPALAPAPAEG